ncbi:MAG: prepilin-type N-terminal cleavage/methylation domain-containing protein [Candidatus Izemoplasma sp.]|nr:prepilin-type N-terminal cleavage/methylation domain-containing protein [Candidatus Izemoplasma sp.]
MIKNLKNNNGLTLLELLISIVVGSIVITTLLSILTLSVQARSDLEVRDRMKTESYIFVEQIRLNLFELQVQSVELIENSKTQTVIDFTHEYDITLDENGVIQRDYSNPVTERLVYDKINQIITYEGVRIHSNNVFFTTGTTLELISIDPGTCDLSVEKCDEGVLQLTLAITFEFNDGSRVDSQTYVTTLLI